MESQIEFINTTSDDGINLIISYNGVEYIVRVSKGLIVKEKKVSCSFTPTFGMDMLDQRQCFIVAEELALEIDKENI